CWIRTRPSRSCRWSPRAERRRRHSAPSAARGWERNASVNRGPMDRRTLLSSLPPLLFGASASAAGLRPRAHGARSPLAPDPWPLTPSFQAGSTAARAPVRPRRLRPGDTVAIVAPATATFFPVDLDIARESLEAMGLKVLVGEHIFARHGNLAGRDEERAARLLPLLDYDAIAANPKVLLGYSDITALLLAIHARTGLVTFHGPVASSRWNRFAYGLMRRLIFDGEALTFENVKQVEPGELAQRQHRIRTLNPGTARGRLLGGNLTVLTALLGSPYLPDFSGAILFLEDTNEAPYRIDRMITQLKLAGVLDKVRGLVFGECTECQ